MFAGVFNGGNASSRLSITLSRTRSGVGSLIRKAESISFPASIFSSSELSYNATVSWRGFIPMGLCCADFQSYPFFLAGQGRPQTAAYCLSSSLYLGTRTKATQLKDTLELVH